MSFNVNAKLFTEGRGRKEKTKHASEEQAGMKGDSAQMVDQRTELTHMGIIGSGRRR
jgi:hypothetical protein